MTFPTSIDIEFYQSKQTLPAWALKVRASKKVVSAVSSRELIDFVVNNHAGIRPTSGELAASNLLAIVSGYRRRGKNLTKELRHIAEEPGCLIDPRKRAAFARKWAAKLGAS